MGHAKQSNPNLIWTVFSESTVVFLLSSICWLFAAITISTQNMNDQINPEPNKFVVSQQNAVVPATRNSQRIEPTSFQKENYRKVRLTASQNAQVYKKPTAKAQTLGLNLQQEAAYKDVQKDLEAQPEERLVRPGETIEERLADKQWTQENNKVQKEAFVEKFVENARSAGFKAKVNKNLDVVEFKKIR